MMIRAGLTLLLSALGSAQVFVVDASAGPGTHFTSISAAVAAVPSGAVLQVRSGTYGPFVIQQKSLTVLGDPGVAVLALFQPPIVVSGLLPGQSVTLRRLSWSNPLGPGELLCQNSAGTILLDECTADGTASSTGGYVRAAACDRLLLRATSLAPAATGIPALQVAQSNVAANNCAFEGFGYTVLQTDGRVQLTACAIVGAAFLQPAITVWSGDLVLNGATTVTGGPLAGGALAIDGTGTVALDPSTAFVNLGSPAVAPSLAVVNRAIPRLDAQTAALGGPATATLAVAAGGTGFLFVGFPAVPFSIAGLADPIWLAAGAALHATGGSPATTGGYTVPNATWVLGAQIGWQGVVLRNSGTIAASNPVVYAHW